SGRLRAIGPCAHAEDPEGTRHQDLAAAEDFPVCQPRARLACAGLPELNRPIDQRLGAGRNAIWAGGASLRTRPALTRSFPTPSPPNAQVVQSRSYWPFSNRSIIISMKSRTFAGRCIRV